MKKRYIPFIACVAILIILIIGGKLALTDKTDTADLNSYEIGTVSEILTDEEYDIGTRSNIITTVTATVKLSDSKEEKVIQEYTSADGRNNVKMQKGDKIVLMHTPDGSSGYYGIFIDFVKTDMLIVVAVSLLILLILIAQIKGAAFLIKTLSTLFAVLLLAATPFITGSYTVLCTVLAVAVIIGANNFITIRSLNGAVYNAAFSAVTTVISTLVSWGLVSIIRLSNSFDLSIFNSSATTDYYVYSNDKQAVIIACVIINLLFSAHVCEYLTRANYAAADEKQGFARFNTLLTGLFSRCFGKLGGILAVFALGFMPFLGMIYANCHSLTALINNEYVIFALCALLISLACCAVTLIIASILLSRGFVPAGSESTKGR